MASTLTDVTPLGTVHVVADVSVQNSMVLAPEVITVVEHAAAIAVMAPSNTPQHVNMIVLIDLSVTKDQPLFKEFLAIFIL